LGLEFVRSGVERRRSLKQLETFLFYRDLARDLASLARQAAVVGSSQRRDVHEGASSMSVRA
jgi:hypothetical protein